MASKLISGVVIPGAIALTGLAAFALLRTMGEEPQRVERTYEGPLVESVAAPERSEQVIVEGQGTVQPAAQVDLVAQVAGTVLWVSPRLEPGGVFGAGDLLVQIDPEEYELAVARTRAEVTRAEYLLDVARGEAAVARRDWELLRPDSSGAGEPDPLVLRLPQVKAAEADLVAARARLREAQLRLDRTRLAAPFDGRVRSTDLDAGQYVAPGQPLARLYGTARVEISVPVPDENLEWLELPAGPAPPAATVVLGAAPVAPP
ncbi:MAG: HlyD family efflux transporter periplasmic adaptor subunit, partial [Gemmatimonadota bacterium]